MAYDTRFLSEKFALEASKILAFNDIHAFLCNRDVPTPCVSFETVRRKAMGAINFTASHNPPEYNGLKFSTANGAPALPEVTQAPDQLCFASLERVSERGLGARGLRPGVNHAGCTGWIFRPRRNQAPAHQR